WFYRREPVFPHRLAIETLSPPFRLYLKGYGLLLPLAAYGLLALLRSRGVRAQPHALLLPVWVVAGFAIAYLPVPFQRKLVMGLHFPLALLAGLGIAGLARLLSPRLLVRRALATALVAITALTSVRFVL